MRKINNTELPKTYTLTIKFVDGKTKEFEVAQHSLMKEKDIVEFVTNDDKWHMVPLINVIDIEFCKNFSKIVADKQKRKRELDALMKKGD